MGEQSEIANSKSERSSLSLFFSVAFCRFASNLNGANLSKQWIYRGRYLDTKDASGWTGHLKIDSSSFSFSLLVKKDASKKRMPVKKSMPGGWTGHLKMDSFSSSFSLLVKKVLTALTMIFNFIGKKSSQWYSIFVKKLTMISKSTSVRLCCQHWWKQILEFFANKKSKMDFLVNKKKKWAF